MAGLDRNERVLVKLTDLRLSNELVDVQQIDGVTAALARAHSWVRLSRDVRQPDRRASVWVGAWCVYDSDVFEDWMLDADHQPCAPGLYRFVMGADGNFLPDGSQRWELVKGGPGR